MMERPRWLPEVPPASRASRDLLLVCLVAALCRLAVVVARAPLLDHDIDAYLEIARNLAAGAGFSRGTPPTPTAFRPPLYPLCLAALFAAGGPPFCIGLMQAAWGTLTAALTYQIGHHLRLGRASLLAGMLVAVDPLLVQHTVLPMTETLCAALITGWCWLFLRHSGSLVVSGPDRDTMTGTDRDPAGNTDDDTDDDTDGNTDVETGGSQPSSGDHWSGRCGSSRCGLDVICGFVLGLICLCRPAFLATSGLIVVGIAARERWHRHTLHIPSHATATSQGIWLWRPSALCLGLLLALVPWTVRNGLVIGKWTPATTHGGYTLLLANNPVYYHQVLRGPQAGVWKLDSLLNWQAELEQQMAAAGIDGRDEPARDRWMSQQAIAHIRSDLPAFLQAVMSRGLRFWGLLPHDRDGRLPVVLTWGIALFYGLIQCAAVVGLRRLHRTEWAAWIWLLIFPLSLWLIHLVYWTDLRMRAPVIPIVALLGARAICSLRPAASTSVRSFQETERPGTDT